FGYVEWCLGSPREDHRRFVVTEMDSETGSILAFNAYNTEFDGRVAFWHASEAAASYTCDRGEFIGRHRLVANPAALHRDRLTGRSGPGLDPCAVLQLQIEIPAGTSKTVVFVLGEGRDRKAALDLVHRYSSAAIAAEAREHTRQAWDDILDAMIVRTPDDS